MTTSITAITVFVSPFPSLDGWTPRAAYGHFGIVKRNHNDGGERRREMETLGSERPRIADGNWFKYHSPNFPTPQTLPPPLLLPKTTRDASSGGNSTQQSVTARELESSFLAREECHATRKRTTGSTRLESSPPELTKRALTQIWPMFLMEREGKWLVAGAQHHPSCFEGKQERKNDTNHIEEGRKGVITHPLSGLTPTSYLPQRV